MVHILEPDFDSGCADLPDSSYYIYSLGGYAPCFYLDFSIRDFKYMSNKNQTLTVTTNPAQMNGSANITFPLNF